MSLPEALPGSATIGAPNTQPTVRPYSRSRLATDRAKQAYASLAACCLCAHRCGVNRLAGETGLCGANTAARIFSLQTEVTDELELLPVFAIALSGCDLRCPFCITAPQSWDANLGLALKTSQIATRARQALGHGARTIMILGGEPTLHLPTVLEIVAQLPDTARLIWKTNGRCSLEARQLLDDLFEVWHVDYKFGNPHCARRLVGAPDYGDVVQDTLLWAVSRSELIVRHLVMPGHVECCWRPIAGWLRDHLPNTKVNLRTDFWPARMNRQYPELNRIVSQYEADRARQIAGQYALNLIA